MMPPAFLSILKQGVTGMSFSARCLPAVLISLFSLTVNLSAQAPAKQTNKTPRGTVSGRVTIKDKGAAGVTVGMRKSDGVVPSFSEPFLKATTDQDGVYRITKLSAGSYEIVPSAPAFVIADNSNSKSKRVIVGEDENVEDINFSLVRGGVITGKVTDADGRPVIQQQVFLYRAEAFNQPSHEGPIYAGAGVQTDDRGIYRMYGLSAGRYKVATGRSDDASTASFGLQRTTYKQVFHPDVADQAKATIVEVSEGSEAKNVDITLGRALQTFAVTGRVVNGESGLPMPNIRFGLQRHVGQTVEFTNTWGTSNGRGDFVVEGLIPGKYGAFMIPNQDIGLRVETLSFDITDQDVSGVTVKLIKGANLTGVVVVESENKTAFEKLSQLQVRAYVMVPAGGGGGIGQSAMSPISPGGGFRLLALPAGTANIALGSLMSSMDTKGFTISRIERDGVELPRPSLEIKEGEQVAGLRVVLSYGSGSVRGVVKLENGSLPPGAQIFARVTKPNENSSGFRPPQVDARGHFLMGGLPPGIYELTVSVGGPGVPLGHWVKQEVNVQDGAVTDVMVTIDLAVKPPMQ
jgi:hypothetical protein